MMQIKNDWEKKLANQVNRTVERTATAVAAGNKNEIKRKELTADFLDNIGTLLQESIARFNASAKTKIEFIGRAKDRRQNDYCGLKFQTRQILFTNTNRGFIRIDLVENEAIQEAAFVLARLSRSGDFITWEEKNLLGVGNRLEPVTLNHLVRKYITFLVTI
jgi:hypothetical protein